VYAQQSVRTAEYRNSYTKLQQWSFDKEMTRMNRNVNIQFGKNSELNPKSSAWEGALPRTPIASVFSPIILRPVSISSSSIVKVRNTKHSKPALLSSCFTLWSFEGY